MPHLLSVRVRVEQYPSAEHYPFCLPVLRRTAGIEFGSPISFFVGENGTGKSTVLEAIATACGIHIWRGVQRSRLAHSPYEKDLHRHLDLRWAEGPVPGSYFSAEIYRSFAELFEEFAVADPGQLDAFGGASLISRSHGESFMSYFASRYRIRGIYFLDEPETALAPRFQLRLIHILRDMAAAGHAQFLIATHSPILLATPGAEIHSFDEAPIRRIAYEQTHHYRFYRAFLSDPSRFLADQDSPPDPSPA